MSELLEKYDSWLMDGSNVGAVTLRQWLEPIEGKEAIIFPPTYAKPERMRDEDWSGYTIDRIDGFTVCQIDSVGSQANRIEPIFLKKPYSALVPQVIIKATVDGKEKRINLLDAGHRAADAIVRFSTLGPQFHDAFQAIQDRGDATLLAGLAPTSLVFGAWDSRATQVKLPRVLRSVIRAFDVRELHRSAQYSTLAGELLEGPDVEVTTKGVKAELGLAHVPSVMTHGGIQVKGEIRRDAALNLVAIRSLSAGSDNGSRTLALRRYILGLALVGLSADQEFSLREGCHLVPDKQRPAEWTIVLHDGTRQNAVLTHGEAIEYATRTAKEFGVSQDATGEFDVLLARKMQEIPEKDRKALLRKGPVTMKAIEELLKKGKTKGKTKEGIDASEGGKG